jgi:hypothetical protein
MCRALPDGHVKPVTAKTGLVKQRLQLLNVSHRLLVTWALLFTTQAAPVRARRVTCHGRFGLGGIVFGGPMPISRRLMSMASRGLTLCAFARFPNSPMPDNVWYFGVDPPMLAGGPKRNATLFT